MNDKIQKIKQACIKANSDIGIDNWKRKKNGLWGAYRNVVTNIVVLLLKDEGRLFVSWTGGSMVYGKSRPLVPKANNHITS